MEEITPIWYSLTGDHVRLDDTLDLVIEVQE